MKRLFLILISIAVLSGCYEDYLKDFDYSGGYIAYQYDLRSFVVGEIETINLTVCLSGVVENGRDRKYDVAIDDKLVTGDLSRFSQDGTSFTAMDGMLGKAPAGVLSGGTSSYVSEAFLGEKLNSLTPLPASDYTAEPGIITVAKGRHTGLMPISPTARMIADPKAYRPYYALGFEIRDADVDSLLFGRNYSVVALKCENRFWGNWYHGGKTVRNGIETSYPFKFPQEDSRVYTLTSVDSKTVRTNRIGNRNGSLLLTFYGNNISVSSDDVKMVPDGRKSYCNDALLLQDRKLYLNYSYRDPETAEVIAVSDSLMFRNRIRDGINEWQDENKEHYK